jgi:hypothetical protein
MNTSKKIAIGIGVAGAAALATWLLTGDRKQKTKDFVSKAANDIKKAFVKEDPTRDDSDAQYV